jgi:toxin ParE1/3/4
MKLWISQPAKDDLVEIWEFIAEHDELAADRYIDHLRLRARELIRHPQLGRPRREIRPGIRSLLVRNHLLFYRVKKSSVEVLRILHGSRDLPRQEFPV